MSVPAKSKSDELRDALAKRQFDFALRVNMFSLPTKHEGGTQIDLGKTEAPDVIQLNSSDRGQGLSVFV